METPPPPRPRVGTFFMLVGFVLLLLFLGSGFSRQPNFLFFLLGIAAAVIGFMLRRGAQRPSSGRFGLLRRMVERRHEAKSEKKKK